MRRARPLLCLLALVLVLPRADAGEPGKAKEEEKKTPPAVTFTYLVADGVGMMGSTAFRVEGPKSPTIYIEAFPKREACKADPYEITKADLIIQDVHGHVTHYDPDVCAYVAKKTGALVLGNARLKADMKKRGIPEEKIIELTPKPGEKLSKEIKSLAVKVTAYGMAHTMMEQVPVATFLVELPNGVRWYHGTCSSGTRTMKWMKTFPELKDLDVMLMDCDVDFAAVQSEFTPRTLVRTHDFKSAVRPAPATVYVDYPQGMTALEHAGSFDVVPRER